MLRGGYTSVKESHNIFEEILLNNPNTKDDVDEVPSGCFYSFTRIFRFLAPRKLFTSKQS
jgi:hypothetical protein